ncbi:ABC transporter ATP-binding protein [Luteimicrobium subarcticum]|uniref:ABC-2 type transport system ATP-binding protein n=1 Tax=Luteimicrobium subarcticum TaxID=620910 RepID=A0A2M8W735_9MICO|nr:ABC transporter ATP-binding protein [Luteimicrobium subarcticum]PJI86702.1 ABC-2 type transport system ATP-binding protein [Luteimicrobium subarcticum]
MSERDGEDLAVATSGLTKRFGAQAAVDGIDLAVPRGGVYGFLGPNGSGKTTTIRMLLGLVRPSAGTVTLLGGPMPDALTTVLPRVGALVEGPAFHPYLSGRANLVRLDVADRTADPRTSAHRVDAALERVDLLHAAAKRYRAYSLGMRQRLGIAAALLRDRELLVLDEPTNGLDPQGTREVRALIGALHAEGVTVLVSSHLLSEIEQVCTHLGVMRAGRLVAQGAVADVRGASRPVAEVTTPDPAAAAAVLVRLGLADVTADGGTSARGVLDGHATEDVVAALVRAGVPVRGFVVHRPSLEDRFIELTGGGYGADA